MVLRPRIVLVRLKSPTHVPRMSLGLGPLLSLTRDLIGDIDPLSNGTPAWSSEELRPDMVRKA